MKGGGGTSVARPWWSSPWVLGCAALIVTGAIAVALALRDKPARTGDASDAADAAPEDVDEGQVVAADERLAAPDAVAPPPAPPPPAPLPPPPPAAAEVVEAAAEVEATPAAASPSPGAFGRSHTKWNPERAPTSIEWLELSGDVDGDTLSVKAAVWFGADTFGARTPWYEVKVKGGSYPDGVTQRRDARSGESRETFEFDRIGPGSYVVSIFLWGERKSDGTQLNVNGPALFIDVK